MSDYWSKLSSKCKISKRARFNYIMAEIEKKSQPASTDKDAYGEEETPTVPTQPKDDGDS